MYQLKKLLLTGLTNSLLFACSDKADDESQTTNGQIDSFITTEVTKFSSPWAMTFLPDGRLLIGSGRTNLVAGRLFFPHHFCGQYP